MDSPKQVTKKQLDDANGEEQDPKKGLRDMVNLLLPDGVMIVLALLMVPSAILPFFIDLPGSIAETLGFADYTIVGVFVIEYFLKAALARDVRKHVMNPWHILDLIIVILPLFDFLQVLVAGLGRSSPILRLLRIARVVAIGGRTVDRSMKQRPPSTAEEFPPKSAIEIRVMGNELEHIHENVPLSQISDYLNSPSHTWVEISSVSESNLEELSSRLNIPRVLLESELVEESYPRVDYFEHYSMIFARIADIKILSKGAKRLFVNRAGLLVICRGQNVITISKTKTSLFNQILERAGKYHSREEPLVVSILYAILKYTLEKDRQVISALEQELMKMESISWKERPPDFLETTFHLKKEVNQLVPSLLHMKEVLSVITSKRMPLEGFNEKHERLFDILTDEASYLHETAQNARDNLLSVIDLHINATSFQLNKVMRIVAVITSLGILPAVLGLLGSNLVGVPWGMELWQVFLGLAVAMIIMGWIFYRLGWLKG